MPGVSSHRLWLADERLRQRDGARPDGRRQRELHPARPEEQFADRLHGLLRGRQGPGRLYTDLVWAKLGFDQSLRRYRNPIAGLKISATTNAALTYALTIVEAGGLYEVARWPGSPGSFTAIDALLGFRYWNNSVDANFDVIGSVDFSSLGIERGRSFAIARSGNLDWVDPVLGLRLRHQFTPSQDVMVRGDVGGFGLQSQFAWQAVGVYSYAWQFSGYQLAGVIGYRALGVNYTTGSGIDTNGVNVVLHGPIIGAQREVLRQYGSREG